MQDAGYNNLSITEVVARTDGIEAAAALKKHCGGMILYIPHESNLRLEHMLSKAIGMATARKVCQELHGTKQYVPRPSSDIESNVLWAARAGLKRLQTADLANCTEAYVYKIVAAAREAGLLPSDEAPLWKIMGYDSPQVSPEAKHHLRRICRGGPMAQRRWSLVAWAKLAGMTTAFAADLIDAGPAAVSTMAAALTNAGYLPNHQRRGRA